MKYQFDLLPDEYKSTPRDYFSIFLAVILIIVAIISIGIKSSEIKKKSESLDLQIETKRGELENIRDKINAKKPEGSVDKVKRKIEFINKNMDTPGTDAVAFLTSFEACVPDGIIIRDLTPKKLTDLKVPFTVNGEASTIQDILEFNNRLQKSNKFIAHLKSNNSAVISDRIIQNFVLEFHYKGL